MMDLDMMKLLGVSDIVHNRQLWRMLICEFLGTFLLIILGIGSCAFEKTVTSPDTVQVALTFGLSVAVIVQCIGNISGGHINPAVTIGFLIVGEMSLFKSILYILVQCLGAISGSALLHKIIPEEMSNGNAGLGVSHIAESIGEGQAFLIEALITGLLLLVVKTVSDPKRKDLYGLGPVLIGLAITVGHLSAIKLTSAGMNPARSLGPALIHNIWSSHWVYWIGPIVGSIISSLIYKILFDLPQNVNQFNL